MNDLLIPLPLVLPLLAAGVSLALGRFAAAQRVIGVAALAISLAGSVVLLIEVDRNGPVASSIGGWGPVGIVLAVDLLAAIMLVVASVMVLVCLVYAIGHASTADDSSLFHPVYLVLASGVAGAFLTADLFNMFVAFEIMLTASYVLLTLGGGTAQLRSGATYIITSLLASALFITGVGLVYAATGTVNLAELATRLQDIPPGLRTTLGLLFLVVFGLKAAVFPLFFWLPDSYPVAPTPVTAVFAGLLTKVGIYAMIRTQTLLFGNGGAPSLLLLSLAGATMVVGVLGAIAQNDMKQILSFHIVSQIGYMLLGLGLFTVAGLAGAIFYIVHHIVVKTALFLVAGLVEQGYGTSSLARVNGLIRQRPWLAIAFLPLALSLAGLPPFSGFVAKLALVQAGLAIDQITIIVISLVVSMLTLFSMTKIWSGVFWGDEHEEGVLAPVSTASPTAMVVPTAVLVVLSFAVAIFGGPLYELTREAAESLLDPSAYIAVVLG